MQRESRASNRRSSNTGGLVEKSESKRINNEQRYWRNVSLWQNNVKKKSLITKKKKNTYVVYTENNSLNTHYLLEYIIVHVCKIFYSQSPTIVMLYRYERVIFRSYNVAKCQVFQIRSKLNAHQSSVVVSPETTTTSHALII